MKNLNASNKDTKINPEQLQQLLKSQSMIGKLTSKDTLQKLKSEEFLKRQRAEVQARATKSDVIITTAQVRGRKAPVLIDAETIEQMMPGSVVVDLAASTGGNCALTQDGKTIQHKGVTILGDSNLPALMAEDASKLYSNNLINFLKYWILIQVMEISLFLMQKKRMSVILLMWLFQK